MRTNKNINTNFIFPNKVWQRVKYKLNNPIMLCDVFVPAGFVTDGTTSPRLLWSIFPPVTKYFEASVVHDYLLTKHKNRKIADDKFKQCLIALGAKPWRVAVLYYAVRAYSTYKLLFKKGNK